jgi:hypothetical protein
LLSSGGWRPRLRRPRVVWALAATGAVLVAALTFWQIRQSDPNRENPLAAARFVQLTYFGGIEQAAAVSRDGRFAAFLSDRDGQMDVWVTQVGTGQFHNLTRGGAGELVNPSVRTLGFSPDGTLVTFWTRTPAGPNGQSASGRQCAGSHGHLMAAEFHWSGDGSFVTTPRPAIRYGAVPADV